MAEKIDCADGLISDKNVVGLITSRQSEEKLKKYTDHASF